jgi:hypothetical protein
VLLLLFGRAAAAARDIVERIHPGSLIDSASPAEELEKMLQS